MKKIALFVIVAMPFLMGCSVGQRTVSQPGSTLPVFPSPSPQLTATALAEQKPLLATLAAQADFHWSVALVQNNVEINAQDNTFNIPAKPFTIRLRISKPVDVYLNVLDTANNFAQIKVGMSANDGCYHGVHVFCDSAMTAATEPGELIIDTEDGLGMHSFVLDARLGELGSTFTITTDGITYERNVSTITLLGPIQRHGASLGPTSTEIPIAQYAGKKLYLSFLAKYREGEIVNEDELQKFVIAFQ